MSVATPERLHTAANALIHRARATNGDEPDADADADAPGTARPLRAADYFARLRTFANPGAWFDKPACCAPPECAARGWVLDACDLLRCASCDARLAYPSCDALLALDDRDAVGATIALALHSAHHEGCAWRETSCAALARAFPEEDEANTRSAFARRARDVAAASDGNVPFCVEFSALRGIDRTDVDYARFRTLMLDARAHAAEDGLEDGIGEDAAPLERRATVDAATALALFGWSAKAIDGDCADSLAKGTGSKSRRVYCCALCGVRAPEWMFTGVASERRRRAEAAASAKKPKTTAAALRGAAGGSYGLNLSPPPSSSAVPFATIVRDETTHPSVTTKWVAATANVASRLRASIGALTSSTASSSPFGASVASPVSLFGAPRPVTSPTTMENAPGDRLASVVVAAMTRRLASNRRKRSAATAALDDDAKLLPPSDATLFDVVREHREYCPWIVATSSSSAAAVAGWSSTLRALAGGAATDSVDEDAARARRARNFAVVDYAKARAMVRKYIGA